MTGDFDPAVSIYLATSRAPAPARAGTAFKSALDEAAGQLADPAGVVAQGQAILADEQLWGALSRSLAAFLTATSTQLYVLPIRLDEQVAVGTHFELGQLWRSVTRQQEALALTLSADTWQLWHATPGSRISPPEVAGNPDRVAPDEPDATVPGLLDELNLTDTKAGITALEDGDAGNVERDLAASARMALKGGVDTYWFDFTAPAPGTLDLTTGELSYADVAAAATAAGVSDLLARVR